MAGPHQLAADPPHPRGSFRVTWEGLFWLMVALILLFQGWLRSVNLVALIACILIALWLLNILWLSRRGRLKAIRLRRRVEGPVFARKPFTVNLEIENPVEHGGRQLGLRVIDRGSHHDRGWFLPVLQRGERQTSHYELTLPRRGCYPWAPLLLTTGYPFGLARRTLRHDLRQETIVLPTLGRVHRGRLRRLLTTQMQVSRSTKRPIRRHPVAQTEFHGLREFRHGDSPRWIHWRTTARVGELMVREFEEPPLDNLIVVLEPWLPRPAEELRNKWRQAAQRNQEILQILLASGPPPPPDKRRAKEAALAKKEEPYRRPLEQLELAVSFAATVCWEWCRHPGSWLGLAVAGPQPEVLLRETGLTRVLPFLENLAVAEGGPNLEVERLLDHIGRVPLPAGPVLLVGTRSSGLDQVLAERLRRPVALLDFSQGMIQDFYEEHPDATN